MLLSTPLSAFQLLCHLHIIHFTPLWADRQRAYRAVASFGSHTHGSHQGDHAALPGAGPHACPEPDERHGCRFHPWHDDWPDIGRHRPFPGASPTAHLCQRRANCNEFRFAYVVHTGTDRWCVILGAGLVLLLPA